MPHPLLTSVYCPFNFLRSLKMVSIEVKQISSLCKTRMRVTVSQYKKYANHCFRTYMLRTQRFASMYDMERGCVCVPYKPLNAGNNQLTIVCAFLYTETCSFRGSQTRMYEHFRRSKWPIGNSFPSLAPVSVLCWPAEYKFYILPLDTMGGATL